MRIIDPESGRVYKYSDWKLVDHLEKLKRDNKSNIWPVIDEVIKLFKNKYPKEWKSYLVRVEEIRATRHNKKYADNAHSPTRGDGTLRYLVDFPEWIANVLRAMYSPEELPMNKQFMVEFAKRYPVFKVPEHI